MNIILPPNGKYTQPNDSDKKGSIWSSFNLDLRTSEGNVLVSPRTIVTTDDITDLGVPVAFCTFTNVNSSVQYAWAVAGKYLFKMNVAAGYQTAFAKETASGAPSLGTNTECSSDVSDMVNYGKDYLIVSTRTRMDFFTASSGVWLNVQYNSNPVTLGDGPVHMMCVYGGRVYVTDWNSASESRTWVRSVSGTDLNSASGTNTLTTSGSWFLDLSNKSYPITSISTIRSMSDGIWVFTINQSENGCWAFKWDGVQATDPNQAYLIPDASGILACVIKDDTPWVIDNNGRLLVFNGGTFRTTEQLGYAKGRLPIKKSKFLKNSLNSVNDRWIHPNGIGIVDGRINILINNEYEDNGGTIEENIASGIWEYDTSIGWYHKMSLSLYTASITDHGQNRVSQVGALYANKTETTDSSANGTMLIGAQLYSDATTTKEVILTDDSNDTLQKYGYLVSPKIYSKNVTDTWNNFYVRHKALLDSGDKIAVKYRTADIAPIEGTITWTGTSTFTTTTNVSGCLGYEVEVLQGKGSGKCAHITGLSNAGGTYTVTVDETFTGATSGTAKARFQSWKTLGSDTDQQVSFSQFSINDPGTWVQIKVCLQFTGKNQIDDMILSSSPSQNIQ
jgi:hypothetical protein